MLDNDDGPSMPAPERLEPKPKRGRPKCFNEQDVLHKAMLLFWEYGYEATSISDLTQALNLTAPSLYRAFGDKSQLFHRCLEYYLKHEACAMDRIFAEAKTAQVALELYLYESVKRLLQVDKPAGCMLLVATMNCGLENLALQQEILEMRQSRKLKIFERLVQGQKDGDLAQSVNIQDLTDYYTTVIQGLTLQARDGVSKHQLNQVVHLAMRTWTLFN